MKSLGKMPSEKLDILMYQGLSDMADNKIQKVDEELIPTFIINEALQYFSELEKYETCHKIKSFFQIHSTFVVDSSRGDWYGVSVKKKQKH